MGTLEMTQIKKRLEKEYKDLIKYATEDKSKQIYNDFFTKALAAYSIKMLYPNESNDSIVKCIVDGSEDNGLDVIYYVEESNELCFVQSKFNHKGNSEPELADIKKFLDGIRDLLELKFDKFNKKVNSMKENIIEILNKNDLKYKAILVYTATKLSEISFREFIDFKNEQNNANDIADFEIINQKRLHSSLYNENQKINLDIPIYEWGKYENLATSFYGYVNAMDVLKWWETYGNNLFDTNIRKVLGTTEINKEIKDTLDMYPEKFWYYNNGITMICDSIEKKVIHGNKRSIGIFDCRGISVVNGAQTIGSIGKYGEEHVDNKNLEEADVPIKIICIQMASEEGEVYADLQFAESITKTNNRQNKIEGRDFLALDENQKRIETQLKIENIKYYLKREEEELISDSSFTVKEATRALAFAKDIESTILARTNIGSIYSDTNHSRYKKLFNSSITGIYVWNCVKINRKIESILLDLGKKSENNKEASILVYSKEIISKIIFDIIDSKKIDKNEIITADIISSYNLESKINMIVPKIQEALKKYNKPTSNIFKNHTEMVEIYQEVTNLLKIKIDTEINAEFDIYNIDTFNGEEKKKLNSFIEKIKNDDLAFEFFKYWISDKYKYDNYYFDYRSNLYFYENNEKFIFRMAYYTKMIISFEYYNKKYESILLKSDEYKELIEANTDEKHRILIDSTENLEKAKKLFDKLFK